jgi:hypothetical protein
LLFRAAEEPTLRHIHVPNIGQVRGGPDDGGVFGGQVPPFGIDGRVSVSTVDRVFAVDLLQIAFIRQFELAVILEFVE